MSTYTEGCEETGLQGPELVHAEQLPKVNPVGRAFYVGLKNKYMKGQPFPNLNSNLATLTVLEYYGPECFVLL